MTLRLYFIAQDWYAENYDLFVWAPDPAEAVKIWLRYYRDDEADADLGAPRVFEVPTLPPERARAISWHDDLKLA